MDFLYSLNFRNTEMKFFNGKTLGKNDLIKRDGHRIKVSTYLKRHGKDGVWDLLHEFELEEDILKEYNIHLETPEEKAVRMGKLKKEETVQVEDVQESISVSSPVAQDFVTTTTDIVEDVHKTPVVNRKDYMNYALYDPLDPPMDSPFYYLSKTGWNNYPYRGVLVGIVRKPIFNTYKYERN